MVLPPGKAPALKQQTNPFNYIKSLKLFNCYLPMSFDNSCTTILPWWPLQQKHVYALSLHETIACIIHVSGKDFELIRQLGLFSSYNISTFFNVWVVTNGQFLICSCVDNTTTMVDNYRWQDGLLKVGVIRPRIGLRFPIGYHHQLCLFLVFEANLFWPATKIWQPIWARWRLSRIDDLYRIDSLRRVV